MKMKRKKNRDVASKRTSQCYNLSTWDYITVSINQQQEEIGGKYE